MQIVEAALIKNTTQKERQEMIKNGFALGSLDAPPPSDRELELANLYIQGNKELYEVVDIFNYEFLANYRMLIE